MLTFCKAMSTSLQHAQHAERPQIAVLILLVSVIGDNTFTDSRRSHQILCRFSDVQSKQHSASSMVSGSLCIGNVHVLCCSYLTLREGTCGIKENPYDAKAI